MNLEEIQSYIQQARINGSTDEKIVQDLLMLGCLLVDIETFLGIKKESKQEAKSFIDRYATVILFIIILIFAGLTGYTYWQNNKYIVVDNENAEDILPTLSTEPTTDTFPRNNTSLNDNIGEIKLAANEEKLLEKGIYMRLVSAIHENGLKIKVAIHVRSTLDEVARINLRLLSLNGKIVNGNVVQVEPIGAVPVVVLNPNKEMDIELHYDKPEDPIKSYQWIFNVNKDNVLIGRNSF
ncbi:MAG: hypothetical protein NTZ20_03325 [Candidatus Levybacteria bacterium]|nr:hypothetical protein [Candidatus Levybacteria bacterium]